MAACWLGSTGKSDVIGEVGFDPGRQWGSGDTSTERNTLRRRPSICIGDTNDADAFLPAETWIGFPVNSFDGLGSHTVTCTPTGIDAPVYATTIITYTYDPLYRLTDAAYTGDVNATYQYAYDAVGNMISYTNSVNSEITRMLRTFDSGNMLLNTIENDTTITGYGYDGNGNLRFIDTPDGDDATFYSYNQRNLLTEVRAAMSQTVVATYAYDGANNRTGQTDYSAGSLPVVTSYSNDVLGLTQVLAATTHSTGSGQATTTHNLYGLDLISQQAGNGEPMRLLLPDSLGSVRQEMMGGNLQTTTTYDPYGNLLAQTGSSGTVYGFTGEQEDSATGLLYLRARYYNSDLYIFMSRDPVAGYAHRPASQNGYNYANNNPINHTDPAGLCIPNVNGGNCYQKRHRGSLIDFQGATSERWTAAEKKPINNAAWRIGTRLADTYNEYTYGFTLSSYIPIGTYDAFDCGEDKKLLRANEAFLYYYGGIVTFFKTNTDPYPNDTRYGEWVGNRTVDVYTDIYEVNNDIRGQSKIPRVATGSRWAIHELGHGFEARLNDTVGKSYYIRNNIMPDEIANRDGFAGPFGEGWQQSQCTIDCNGEIFADMFIGWNYNRWDTTDEFRVDAEAKASFMNNHMATWISMVIDHGKGWTKPE